MEKTPQSFLGSGMKTGQNQSGNSMNSFRELFMKSLIAALALLATLTVSAQTLKWSYPTLRPFGWATDGHGSLAVLHHADQGELALISWVDATGRTLLTNAIPFAEGLQFASSTIRIVHFSQNVLAVNVQVNYEHAPGTNFVRRFRRNGTFSDTVLAEGEETEPESSVLADNRGFFTYQRALNGNDYLFRRYSN